MPWKETCALDERMKLIANHLQQVCSITELCRRYNVSRPTAYKWIKRYTQEGATGLQERSRAPKQHPNQTPVAIEDKLLAMRQRYPHWGPRKLLWRLAQKEPQSVWPAASTVGMILQRHGLTKPRRRRRPSPDYAGPWHAGAKPNEVWAADFKGWFKTQNGSRIDPLTISDWDSRYLFCCQAVERTTFEQVQAQFKRIFREYGLPEAIRTDNGVLFASVGLGGLSRLSVWWLRLGIMPERIQKGCPQENGRHERMHKTLKENTAKPPRQTPKAQQRAFDAFRQEYNEERPHEALGMQVPAQRYQTSKRTFPNRLPDMEYDQEFEVRRVRSSGEIKWAGKMFYLSEALIGERVGFKPLNDEMWSVHFGPLPLATYSVIAQRFERLPQIKPDRKV